MQDAVPSALSCSILRGNDLFFALLRTSARPGQWYTFVLHSFFFAFHHFNPFSLIS